MALIDPITGDMTVTVSGDLERVQNSTLELVMWRLHTRRGTAIWDLSFGSELHELSRAKLNAATLRRAESMVRDALAPLVREDVLSELQVSARTAGEGRLELSGTFLDTQQQPATFTVFVEL